MNNRIDIIKYLNSKRVFMITDFMAEFKLSYREALETLYAYKQSGNLRQLNDFRFQLYRSIVIEASSKEEPEKEEAQKPESKNTSPFFGLHRNRRGTPTPPSNFSRFQSFHDFFEKNDKKDEVKDDEDNVDKDDNNDNNDNNDNVDIGDIIAELERLEKNDAEDAEDDDDDDDEAYDPDDDLQVEKKPRFKCLDIIVKIVSISPNITKLQAEIKADAMRGMFEVLEDKEMIATMEKVLKEFKECSDEDFENLKKNIHGGKI